MQREWLKVWDWISSLWSYWYGTYFLLPWLKVWDQISSHWHCLYLFVFGFFFSTEICLTFYLKKQDICVMFSCFLCKVHSFLISVIRITLDSLTGAVECWIFWQILNTQKHALWRKIKNVISGRTKTDKRHNYQEWKFEFVKTIPDKVNYSL